MKEDRTFQLQLSQFTKMPKKVNSHIRLLCSRISPTVYPIHVNVSPHEKAQPLDCFNNVKKMVEADGGSIIYGWSIWEWPYVMVEGVFHAIWERPDGCWVDITPNDLGTSRILFLRDPNKGYSFKIGERFNNERISISGREIVKEFIKHTDKLYEFEEANTIGNEIHIVGDKVDEYQKMKLRRAMLMQQIISEVVPRPRNRHPQRKH